MELKELKKTYSIYAKKYSLPSFQVLNGDFEIERIDKESDIFLRVVRKKIMEKIINSMSFVEILLNNVNPPKIYYVYIKNMSLEERKELERVYDILSRLSIDSLSLEIDSNDKLEAELIKKACKEWSLLKPFFKKVILSMRNPVLQNNKKEKSYFG